MTRETRQVLNRSLVAAVALIAATLLFLPKLNFIRYEPTNGVLLWREDEAYLLIGNGTTGFRLSVFDYMIEPLKEYFYATALPSDSTSSFTIMKITRLGVERYENTSQTSLSRVTPVSGEIYARCLQGICKWTGTQFEAISTNEVQRVGGESRLTNEDFSNVDGWSRRRIRSSLRTQEIRPYTFSADLNDGAKVVVSGYTP